MTKKNKKSIVLFVLAVIILYFVIYIVPKVTDIFETTYLLEPGDLQVSEEVDAYVIRDEQVYEAGSAGTLHYLVEEGIHVRKGTKIVSLDMTADKESEESSYQDMIDQLGSKAIVTDTYRTKTSGVVSYHMDGYEAYFSPDRVEALKQEDLKKINVEAKDVKRDAALAKEPLFKICDNDNWYVLCWVEAGSISRYEVGQTIGVAFENGTVQARVEEIIEDGDQWKLLLWTNQYYDDFTQLRTEPVSLVSEHYTGLIVENKSLTTQQGKVGVMIKNTSGDYMFKPVKVIASDGEFSALKEASFIDADGNRVNTVNVYDEVLRKPGKGD